MDKNNERYDLYSEFTHLPVNLITAAGGCIEWPALAAGFPCPYSIPELSAWEQLGIVSGPYHHQYFLMRNSREGYIVAGPFLAYNITDPVLRKLCDELSVKLPVKNNITLKTLKSHYSSIPVLSRQKQHQCLELMNYIFKEDLPRQEAPAAGDDFFSIVENSLAVRRTKQLSVYDYFSVKLHIKQAILDAPSQLLFDYLQHTFEFNIPDLIDGDPLRTRKSLSLTFLSLIVKTAIEEGLDTFRAFIISDFYLVKIEKAISINELDRLLFDAICRLSKELKVNKSHQYNKYIRHCISYIRDNLSKSIQLKEIAAHLGISAEHLSRLFSKEMGKSFSQYILDTRMTEARRMLVFTRYSCAEIAYLTGFSSQCHFAKAFKEYLGITPGKYRIREGIIGK